MPRVVSKETLVRGSKFDFVRATLRRDPVAGEGEGEFSREFVLHPGAVVILPLLASGDILLIRCHRAAVDEWIWELPAGTLDAGEAPEKAAARELIEETGHEAGRLTPLGSFYTSPGMSDEVIHAFLATDLREVGQALEETEFIEVRPTLVAEAFSMMERGELRDAKSMLPLFLAKAARLLPEDGA